MTQICQSHDAGHDLVCLLDAAAGIYGAPGDATALAIAKALRGARTLAGRTPGDPPAALKFLPQALEALPPGPLAGPVRACADSLPWADRSLAKSDGMAGSRAYVEIAGPGGVVLSDALRFGFYLQSPRHFYPSHSHEAAERYHTLSGASEWQKDDTPFQAMAPGTTILHAPWQRHATKTGREALLALWVWTGNLDFGTYRIYDSRP